MNYNFLFYFLSQHKKEAQNFSLGFQFNKILRTVFDFALEVLLNLTTSALFQWN